MIILISCTNDINEYYVQGEIIVIGNEPFATLAIKDINNNYYALDIKDKNIEKRIYSLQGSYIIIKYNYSYLYLGLIYINVIDYKIIGIDRDEQQYFH